MCGGVICDPEQTDCNPAWFPFGVRASERERERAIRVCTASVCSLLLYTICNQSFALGECARVRERALHYVHNGCGLISISRPVYPTASHRRVSLTRQRRNIHTATMVPVTRTHTHIIRLNVSDMEIPAGIRVCACCGCYNAHRTVCVRIR